MILKKIKVNIHTFLEKKECTVSFGLKYISSNDPGYEQYIIDWCIYFTPQKNEFKPKTYDESLKLYKQTIENRYAGKDPCDYELGTRKLIDISNIDNPINPSENSSKNINLEDIFDIISDFSENDIFEPKEINENIIKISINDLENISKIFKNIREEKKAFDRTSGFIERLNKEQNIAFKIITKKENKKAILLGKAGTGKSFVINALREFYGKNIMVAAPTGVAADNINAQTIHSILHIGGNYMSEMTNSKTIACFIEEFTDKEVLVLDEYTMISAKMLSFIDRRLKIAKNEPNKEFGGMKIILCGDPRQLPPVGERLLWSIPSSEMNVDEALGVSLYKTFTTIVSLKSSVRQRTGSYFAELCDRIGEAKMTEEDYDILKDLNETNNFENSINLCVRKNKANIINDLEITKLTTKPYTINAIDKGNQTSKKNRIPEIQGLYLSVKLKVGAQVMLTNNLNVETGLVNGSTGKIVGLYVDEQNECIGALVDFEKYTGKEFIDSNNKSYVPILMIEKSERGVRRKMIPLVLCFAMTIHKSQGLTLHKIDVHLGEKEDTPGQTFVAISRVKSIENLRIHDVSRERFKILMDSTPENKKPKEFIRRMEHINELEILSDKTLEIHHK